MMKPDWSLARLPMNVDRREDIPLVGAMLLWDDGYRRTDCECAGYHHQCGDLRSEPIRLAPLVVDHSHLPTDPTAWDNATGACFDYWLDYSDEKRLSELLRDAWMAVARDGVDAAAMHAALLAIPEFRAMIHPDELPADYRDE